MSQCAHRPLYAGLLGSAWADLAEPVRAIHASGLTVRAGGRLRIAHGRGRAARWLARVLRLPRASEAAETRLVVTSRDGGEQWSRTFDGQRLDSQQRGAGGDLAERFGVLEFRFRLEASQGSLVFRQREAALVCGRVRLRIPAVLAPRVDAREDPAGARQIHVHVRVAFPVAGPVVTYDGTIGIEEPGA